MGSVFNITLTSEGHVRVQSSGTVHYSGYFTTTENVYKANNNTTFAYMQELSGINVTSIDLQADLPAGSYGVYFVLTEAGNVSVPGDGGVAISYPSSNSNAVPLDILAIVLATALVSVLATYGVMSHIKSRS